MMILCFCGPISTDGRLFGRPSFFPSVSPTDNLPLMTRAGLEPATYGLKERMLIGVLASLSIVRACPGCWLRKQRLIGEIALDSGRIVELRVFSGF
jgi:hypothetical protein